MKKVKGKKGKISGWHYPITYPDYIERIAKRVELLHHEVNEFLKAFDHPVSPFCEEKELVSNPLFRATKDEYLTQLNCLAKQFEVDMASVLKRFSLFVVLTNKFEEAAIKMESVEEIEALTQNPAYSVRKDHDQILDRNVKDENFNGKEMKQLKDDKK